MKFDCGETYEEKLNRLCIWHKVFLFIPRKVGKRDCRWLEYVNRRRQCKPYEFNVKWYWEYRAIDKEFN